MRESARLLFLITLSSTLVCVGCKDNPTQEQASTDKAASQPMNMGSANTSGPRGAELKICRQGFEKLMTCLKSFCVDHKEAMFCKMREKARRIGKRRADRCNERDLKGSRNMVAEPNCKEAHRYFGLLDRLKNRKGGLHNP